MITQRILGLRTFAAYKLRKKWRRGKIERKVSRKKIQYDRKRENERKLRKSKEMERKENSKQIEKERERKRQEGVGVNERWRAPPVSESGAHAWKEDEGDGRVVRDLYARGEWKRQLQLRTAATRPPPLDSLRIRFYRSLLLSLFISSLPPSSSSFVRLSFPPAASTQRRSSPRRTSATRLRPSLFTAAVTRTHTHTRTQGRARPRGPPDSSPAPRQTPNGPTATVDTLPNFSVHGVDGEEEGRGEATGRIPRFESISRYSRDNVPEGGGENTFPKNGEKFVDSIVKRVVSSIMKIDLKRVVRRW